jgi:hypothetical protein
MTTNITELNGGGGTVVLRGHTVNVDSDIGAAFVVDCVRHIEDLVSADALKAKYGLDDTTWAALGENTALQLAVGAQKERRVRNGDAAREKAQALFLAAPNVLSAIVNDESMSPRHRIDACRELRATAAAGSETGVPANDKERFTINISFGSNKLIKDVELKPVKPEVIEQSDEHEAEYEF